jgi:uncharacterized coiled-coil protein SlyX
MTGFVLKLEPDAEMAAVLADIVTRLDRIERKLMNTDQAIAALTTKVAEQGTVIESAVTLITGLAAQLQAAKDDPQQIQAIIDQVEAQRSALAAAVLANTPQADGA